MSETVANSEAAGSAGAETEPPDALRLLRVAMAARRMVEDGHPDSREWFRIMAEHLSTVMDLTDTALMDGEEVALRAQGEPPQTLDVDWSLLADAARRAITVTESERPTDFANWLGYEGTIAAAMAGDMFADFLRVEYARLSKPRPRHDEPRGEGG